MGELFLRYIFGEDVSWCDLIVYLWYIENVDVMIGCLFDYLCISDCEIVVCFYGDYVFVLFYVFDKLGVFL